MVAGASRSVTGLGRLVSSDHVMRKVPDPK